VVDPLGSTSDSAGSRRTSSKVSPSGSGAMARSSSGERSTRNPLGVAFPYPTHRHPGPTGGGRPPDLRTPRAKWAPWAGHAARATVRRYGGIVQDEPIDPFAGDPADPSNELADLDEAESEPGGDPLTPAEREDVLE